MSHFQLKEPILSECPQSAGHAQRTAERQKFSDLILHRLSWLEEQDRLLLELVYEKGLSYRQIARLTGIRESSISRRVRKLTGRLLNRTYSLCLLHRSELSPMQLCIARNRYVLGKSRRDIACQLRITLYSVDRHLQRLEKILEPSFKKSIQAHRHHWKEGA